MGFNQWIVDMALTAKGCCPVIMAYHGLSFNMFPIKLAVVWTKSNSNTYILHNSLCIVSKLSTAIIATTTTTNTVLAFRKSFWLVVQTVPLQCIPLCLNHRWVYATLCNWVLDLIFSHSSISISPVCPQYVPSISWLQVQFHRFPWVCKPPGSTTTAGEKKGPRHQLSRASTSGSTACIDMCALSIDDPLSLLVCIYIYIYISCIYIYMYIYICIYVYIYRYTNSICYSPYTWIFGPSKN